MSSFTIHPYLWSLCAVQFGLLSILATKLLGESQNKNPSIESKMSTTPPTSSGQIRRITMFKIPEAENQQKLVDAYGLLAKEQQKGGQPYILSTQASIVNDPRSKGYTVVAETQFANVDDMKYYDTECAAHMTLKKGTRALGVTEPPLVVHC